MPHPHHAFVRAAPLTPPPPRRAPRTRARAVRMCERRLFSNVARDARGRFARQPPPTVACTCLVAGTMIGAGVLALPSVSDAVGFVPSSLALLGVWAYMLSTALLISGASSPFSCLFIAQRINAVAAFAPRAELTVNSACALGRPTAVSMLSLASLTLGVPGSVVASVSYTLLHYAILTAYTAEGASDVMALLRHAAHALHVHVAVPAVLSSPSLHAVAFCATIGALMLSLPPRHMQRLNNVLVAAVVVAFGALLSSPAAAPHWHTLLSQQHWQLLPSGALLPVLFVSCVFHNVVPTVSMRLEGDARRIRRVIVVGSAVPLLMFVAYNAIMLANGAGGGGAPQMQQQLSVSVFSTLAIVTSFIGFVDGLTELSADARASLCAERFENARAGSALDMALSVAPPALFASVWPHVFLRALDVAGTFGIAVLFGVLPVAMTWRLRRRAEMSDMTPLLAGGDVALALLMLPPLALMARAVWLAAVPHAAA
eukprot:TRINITY_DN876_c0_g1_i1.p1 TRINITY_DN876_c0_g1~~TRINITY_DN876_c0_g1_i1.p1  ORF type:complete len:486 (-),score=151.07 TRINITY_DN876_c0_g1_i1:160-1617(-)